MPIGSAEDRLDNSTRKNTPADAAISGPEIPPFELLETLRLEHGAYSLLDRHLDRLVASAAYFDIPIHRAALLAVLSEHRDQFPHETRRVRLLVGQHGTIRVESATLAALPALPLLVTLAKTPVDHNDRFLFHKTTHRLIYDYHRRQQPDAFEVLLWNERGELTEFTIGNLVVEQDRRRWTPRRESGLLAGTFRAELLAQGMIHERALKLSDLPGAERIWLINSVRGWVPVQLSSCRTPPSELF